jgi:hypothetical protein
MVLIEARLIVDIIMTADSLVESRGRKVATLLMHILLLVIKLFLLSVEAILGIHVGAVIESLLVYHLWVLTHD